MTPSHLIRMGAHALILLIGMHFCFAPFCTLAADGANTLDLSGKWALQLDRDDKGVDGKWFAAALPKPDASIPLPGSLSLSGIGDDVTVDTKWMGGIVDRSWFTAPEYEKYRQPGNVKVPFWLQPDKYYAGAAWYQRDIDVSVTWKALRVVLTLERPHWETRVWVDDRAFGSNNSLGTPHEYDLGLLTPGKHRLTIRVDNRMVVDVGRDSHSVSDHTQGNWNGIVGRMELRATPPVWIEDLQVFPHVATKSATVKGKIGNASGQAGRGAVKLSAQLFNVETTVAPVPVEKSVDVSWDEKGGAFEAEIALGATAQTWSEFTPALYRLTAALDSGKDSKDAKDNKETISVVFGLREVSVDGTQIAVNGRKIFIRGTLDCCIFPKTGHPPTDVASWKRIVSIAKAHGLNNIRFHSWCPPEAAFIAADELGFYYQVECSSWANSTTSLGDGKPVDQWLYDEADRMLKYYGNHPSFLLMPYGNEPGGKKHAAYLAKWVSNYKAKDSRRLYTSGAGWPEIPENQFHVVPAPRIQGWGQGLKSRINGRPPETQTDYSQYIKARNVPVISHEIGEWCVYPNFDEIPKYTGYLKPKNFEIFRESLKARGMLDQAHDFLMASGKLQTLCYKEDIESALRTAGMGGFQLLDLHDFPGQGTALVGVLDPFWDSKGYVTPEEYHRFACETVPLARMAKRVWTNDEDFTARIEIAHYGPKDFSRPEISWKIREATGAVIALGLLPWKAIPAGMLTPVGEMRFPLSAIKAAKKLNVEIALAGTAYANDWDFWVYPAGPAGSTNAVAPTSPTGPTGLTGPTDILISENLDEGALAKLKEGGKVLLAPPPSAIKGDKNGRIPAGFSSIFWNTAWTHRQPPHTLGVLCDPKHPALAQFPTEFCSNWQWWDLVTKAHPFIMNDLPPDLRPIVQIVDDWFTNRRLGLVFEAQTGGGRLLACGIDLKTDWANRPVARQMRQSLLAYMNSDGFKPSIKLEPQQVMDLLGAAGPSKSSSSEMAGARVIRVDSEETSEGDYKGANAIDGDPETFWHTGYSDQKAPYPHEITIDLGQSKEIAGFTYLPRQDKNPNGVIARYEIYASDDPQKWGEAAAQGEFKNIAKTFALQRVAFKTAIKGRYLRFVAISAANGEAYACAAEIGIVMADKN